MIKAQKFRFISMVLAVLGLIDSLYLTVIKLTNLKGLCVQGVGDCWTVNTSRYSELFGIPISILGAGSYLLLISILFLEAKSSFWHNNSPLLIFGITLVGVIYSAYLTYIEIAVLKAICPFCVFSALLMVSLLGLSIARLVNDQVELNTTV